MARDYRLLIGATGWSHAGWLTDFYPEDLPGDWQLGYYANEFPVVLVTDREWALPNADAGQWCEDTERSFQFVIEIKAATKETIQQQLDRLAGFGSRCVGIILCTPANSDVATIKAQLEVIGDSWPVCLDFGNDEPDKTLLLWLQEQNIGWCWHGVGAADGLQQGTLAVSRIRAQQDNPRQTRQWVETALAGSNEHCRAILLFGGEPPAIELMRQAQVILDLL
jgi:hypothetical protein